MLSFISIPVIQELVLMVEGFLYEPSQITIYVAFSSHVFEKHS